jgi:hypothetical protein
MGKLMENETHAQSDTLPMVASAQGLSVESYEEQIEKIQSEFRDTGLRLHAAAAENEVLRESLKAALQAKARLEHRVAELEAHAEVQRLGGDLASVPWRAVGIYKRLRRFVPLRVLLAGARIVDNTRRR